MAGFHGKNGKVMWDSSTGYEDELKHCTDWSCEVEAELADATEMGVGYVQRLAGHLNWSASVTCNFDGWYTGPPFVDDATTAEMGQEAKLELWLDESGGAIKVLYGTAICNGISFNTQ